MTRRIIEGATIGLVVLLAVVGGEVFLRTYPPDDLKPFLPEYDQTAGPYQPSENLGFAFASFDALVEENPRTLKKPLQQNKGYHKQWPADTWALFGTSFVHMRGALADTIRREWPDQPIQLLDRREKLPVRVAQLRTLLEKGYRPSRAFFVIMPVDLEPLLHQPLKSLRITTEGNIAYRAFYPHPGLPNQWLEPVVTQSRFLTATWIRLGWHKANPWADRSALYDGLPRSLEEDVTIILGELQRLQSTHHLPISLILIPTHRQSKGQRQFYFQDDVKTIAQQHQLDVIDPRQVFVNDKQPASLYLADGHLSKKGNLVLLDQLQKYRQPIPGQLARQADQIAPH